MERMLDKAFLGKNYYITLIFLAILSLSTSYLIVDKLKNISKIDKLEKRLEVKANTINKLEDQIASIASLENEILQKTSTIDELESKLESKTKNRWYDYNMREFCEKAELLNVKIGFKCPDIDKIIEDNK